MALYRISNLVLLQLGNKFNIAKKGRANAALMVALTLAGVVGMVGVFLVILLIFKSIFYMSLSRNFLFFLITIIEVFNLVAITVGMASFLYNSKDNPILLSLPAESTEVFYSKLIVSYINEFSKNLFIVFPLMLAFGFINALPYTFFIATIAFAFVLPLIMVLIGSVLSIPFMLFGRLLKKVQFLYVFLVVALCVVVFYGIYAFIGVLPNPLRLKAAWNMVEIGINYGVSIVAKNSLFLVWVANLTFGKDIILSIVYLLALIIGLFILNILLSRPLFFSLSSHSLEQARQKKHKTKTRVAKTTYGAFLRKEITISIRSVGQLVEEYILIAILPFALYILNGVLGILDLNAMGEVLTIALNIMVGLLLITASNQAAATALSKEGGEFVLLKTAPSKTYMITWAKMTSNALISTLFMALSLVIVGLFGVINPMTLVKIGIIFIICNIAHILWSAQLDIKNPLMREYAATGVVSDNKNVSKSILFGSILAIIMGIVFIIAYLVVGMNMAFYATGIVSIIYLIIRFYFFNLNLKCLFEDLEF